MERGNLLSRKWMNSEMNSGQIGRINLSENDTVWESFREANRNF